MIDDYATGRRFSPVERALFSAAARDPRVARRLEAYGTRWVGPQALVAPALIGRVLTAGVRHRLGGGRRTGRPVEAVA